MKTKATVLLMLPFIWLSSQAQAQVDTTRSENTIVRVDRPKNPYSRIQTQWFVKNGFNANDYDWSDQRINAQLKESLNKRTGATFFGMMAGVTGALALSKFAFDEEGGGAFLVLSITSAVISGGKMQKSKRQLQQIEKWRAEPRGEPENQVSNTTEFSLKSPYKPSQNKFLLRNGFDLHGYTWDNEQINLNLDRAIKSRSSGNVMLGMSIAAFFAGSIAKMAAATHDDQANKDQASKNGNFFYAVSGGFLMGSIIFSSSAKKNVNVAQRIKNERK